MRTPPAHPPAWAAAPPPTPEGRGNGIGQVDFRQVTLYCISGTALVLLRPRGAAWPTSTLRRQVAYHFNARLDSVHLFGNAGQISDDDNVDDEHLLLVISSELPAVMFRGP